MINKSLKKSVIVNVLTSKEDVLYEKETVSELKALLYGLQIEPIKVFEARTKFVNPKFFIGAGKIKEIKHFAKINSIDYIAFSIDLSSKQIYNIEKEVGLTCIDRTAIILKTFSDHARTEDAKIQVEAAKLNLDLSRLSNSSIYFDQQKSYIGAKGPGEKKIEERRRYIERKIHILQKKLLKIETQKKERRKKRLKSGIPIVALIGYTNSGKSTLMKALTGADALIEDKPFATLDTLVRATDVSHERVIFIDTVGFIRNLPLSLMKAFKSTISEILDADLLIHVIDISSDFLEEHKDTVIKILEDFFKDKMVKVFEVYNKVDLIAEKNRSFLKNHEDVFFISALKQEGVKELLSNIYEFFNKKRDYYELKIPYSRPDIRHSLYEKGIVIKEKAIKKGWIFTLKEDKNNIEKLKKIISSKKYF